MSRKLKVQAIVAVVIGSLARMASSSAIDLDELRERDEIYVVALYTGYQSEAKYFDGIGHAATAEFLRARADAVETGSELFPLHPMVFPAPRSDDENGALMSAYNETFALVGSNATEIAPNLIAAVQIAYETWLFSAAVAKVSVGLDSAQRWRAAFDRFVNWSEGIDVVAHSAGGYMPATYILEPLSGDQTGE
jgi:hypothetical protein